MTKEEKSALLQDLYKSSVSSFYDCLEQVINNAHAKYRKNDPNADLYRFKNSDSVVNLVAIRGLRSREPKRDDNENVINPTGMDNNFVAKLTFVESSDRGNKTFDDTMFVVYQKGGVKYVKEFALNTEHGPKGNLIIANGQFLYQFKNHRERDRPIHFNLRDGYKGERNYRVLGPLRYGVSYYVDNNLDGVVNEEEKIQSDSHYGLNIHYGGERLNSTVFSEGCQVIWNWSEYIEFMTLLESDISIIGSKNNELVPAPPTDGTRDVVYTIVNVEELLQEIENLNPVMFPLAADKKCFDPLKFYLQSEMNPNGIGGTFGLALMRNVHGGAHFWPEGNEKRVPVRAMAPGYIVAVRLPQNCDSKEDKEIIRMIRNYYGMVLIRHEYQEKTVTSGSASTGSDRSTSTDAPDDEHAFYSLYMHLAPEKNNDYTENVQWYRQIKQREFGTLIPVPFDESTSENYYWLKKTFAEGTEQEVWGDPGKVDTSSGFWACKKPLASYGETLDNLKKGELVTFTEPYLMVKEGDIIGYIDDPQLASSGQKIEYEKKTASGSEAKASEFGSGYLHWEVFSTTGDNNAIRKLKTMFDGLKTAGNFFTSIEELKNKADNFWSIAELKQKLAPALVGPERTAFEAIFDTSDDEKKFFSYRSKLLSLFNDLTTFGSESVLSEGITVIEEPGDVFLTPFTLNLDLSSLPVPSRNAHPVSAYKLKYSFSKKGVDGAGVTIKGKWEITLNDTTTTTFNLLVPSGANTITIELDAGSQEAISIDNTPFASQSIDLDMFEAVTKKRWRNALLTHMNEWTEDGITQLKETLTTNGISIPWFDNLKKIAWWQEKPLIAGAVNDTVVTLRNNRDNSSAADTIVSVYDYLFPENEPKKLFGDGAGQLSFSSPVDNMHPVTFIWMLNILSRKNKITLRTNWDRKVFRDRNSPVALNWGIYTKTRTPVTGDKAVLFVMDDDFEYSEHDSTEITINLKNGSDIFTFAGLKYKQGGYLYHRVPLSLWGTWEMTVNDFTRTVNSPDIPNTITIVKPQFDDTKKTLDTYKPTEMDGGEVYWIIPMKPSSIPAQLDGLVEIHAKPLTGGAEKKAYIPATAFNFKDDTYSCSNTNLIVEDGCVTGYSDAAIAQMLARKHASSISDIDHKITGNITYSDFLKNQKTIRIACSLADVIQRIRTKADVTMDIAYVSADGKTAVINKAGTIVANVDSLNSKIYDKINEIDNINSEITFVKVIHSGKCYGIKVTLKGALAKFSDCPKLIGSNIDHIDNDLYITKMVTGKTQISEKFSFSDYLKAQCKPVALKTADVMKKLKEKKSNLDFWEISADGYVCICNDSKNNVPELVASNSHIAKWEKVSNNNYQLTVRKNMPGCLTVEFDRTLAMRYLTRELSSETKIEYFYTFIAVNGVRFRSKYASQFQAAAEHPADVITDISEITSENKISFYNPSTMFAVIPYIFTDCKIVYTAGNGFTSVTMIVKEAGGTLPVWGKMKVYVQATVGTKVNETRPVYDKTARSYSFQLNYTDITNATLKFFIKNSNEVPEVSCPPEIVKEIVLRPKISNFTLTPSAVAPGKYTIAVAADFIGIGTDKDFTLEVSPSTIKTDKIAYDKPNGIYGRCNSNARFTATITCSNVTDITAVSVKLKREYGPIRGVPVNELTIGQRVPALTVASSTR